VLTLGETGLTFAETYSPLEVACSLWVRPPYSGTF
jgi:hypothetical protein